MNSMKLIDPSWKTKTVINVWIRTLWDTHVPSNDIFKAQKANNTLEFYLDQIVHDTNL